MKHLSVGLLASLIMVFSVRAGQYFQDFSRVSVGATSFGDGSVLSSDHLGTVAAVQDATFKELGLTANGTGSTHSAFLLPDLDFGEPVYAFSAKWNSQVYGNFPNAADGFSFNFGQVGALNLISGDTQEDGYGTGICLSVHTFNGNNPGFYLRINGTIVAAQPYFPAAQWGVNSNTRHLFEVDWNYTNGISVSMDGQAIFTNVATPGYSIQGGNRFAWGARCGGSSEEFRLDNIVVVTGGNLVQVPMSSPYFSDSDNSQSSANAFDGNTNSVWEDFSFNHTPLGIVGGTVPAGTAIKAYALMAPYNTGHLAGPQSAPAGWLLQGSTNGSSWNVLGSGAARFVNAWETRCFMASTPAVYPAYELNANIGNGFVGVGLAELKFYKFNPVAPGAWTQHSGAPTSDRGGGYYLAGSSNLVTLVQALSAYGIYYSSDSGVTWTASDAPNASWNSIASSADGTKMVAAGQDSFGNGALYISANSGVHWSAGASLTNINGSQMYAVALSADGTKVAAATSQGIYLSTDSGHTWARTNTAFSARRIVSSPDGTKLAALTFPAQTIFVSTNSGVTWTQSTGYNGSSPLFYLSADGTKLFTTTSSGSTGYLSVSSDFGATWTPLTFPPMPSASLAVSADGTKIVAFQNQSGVYISGDAGATWTKSDAPDTTIAGWQSIVSSAGGTKLATVDGWTYAPVSVTAPSPTTLAASAVQVQGATLNGAVNPNSMPTAAWFRWGTSTAYGNVTAITNLTGGLLITNSAVITGLAPSTTYHFQMVGSNALGGALGADMTFTTSATLPPVVTTLAANQSSPSSAQLNATVNPELVATGAWFQWGASTNYGNSTPVQTIGNGGNNVAVTATVSGLNFGIYHCRVVATNSLGTSTGADVVFYMSSSNAWFNIGLPGNTITPTSANSPTGEGASNAIDATAATKYLNTDKLNTGFTVSPSNAAGQPVRAISLISASDAPERDPASFVLYGSTNGANFVLIASNAVPPFLGRNTIQTIPFANTNIYSSYKIVFPTVQNTNTANSMQIGEVELLPYGELTQSYGSTKVLTPSGAALNTDAGATDALLDRQAGGDTNKIVVTNVTGNVTVLLTSTGTTQVKGLEIIGGDDDATYPGRTPSFVQLEGSNDGTNFVSLLFNALQVPTANMQIRSFSMVSNTNRFAKYRVTFGPPISGNILQVGELRLFGISPVVSWTASLGPDYWTGVACSADGMKLAAAAGELGSSGISISSDFGTSWQQSSAPVARWSSIASSADGTKLFAGQGYDRGNLGRAFGYLHASVDSGASWQFISQNACWLGVAASADGKQVVAAASVTDGSFYPGIYISKDYGANWSWTTATASNVWSCVASSANGTKLAAAGISDYTGSNPGAIYISTDSGSTWNLTTAPTNRWKAIASSADGTKLAAAVSGGGIYLSTNSGASWALSAAPANGWVSIASSADGTKLIAASEKNFDAAVGSIYQSTDSGATWTIMSAPANQWASVACSADGTKLIAAAYQDVNGNPGMIYTWQLPELTATVAANHLALTWTTNASGLELQTTANLANPAWTTVTNAATVVNGHYQILLSPSGPSAFYRLGAQ